MLRSCAAGKIEVASSRIVLSQLLEYFFEQRFLQAPDGGGITFTAVFALRVRLGSFTLEKPARIRRRRFGRDIHAGRNWPFLKWKILG
jgi:hypothetical protein